VCSAGPANLPSNLYTGVIALDGPSGTGKSTVAVSVARALGLRYLDTGAMYRAATLAVLEDGAPLSDAAAVAAVLVGHDISISTDPDALGVRLDGRAVDDEIRSTRVTNAVSEVSAVPAVRTRLVAAQRALIEGEAIVVEGRDIATVVWPQATTKIFITAHAETRAQRRAGQLGRVDQASQAQIGADLDRRDRFDSTRATSPLTQADDSIELDTTELTIDETVARVIDIARATE
jgi:cytidylate kinase